MAKLVRPTLILAFVLAGAPIHGVESTDLVLKGQATLRYAWVVDVYEARLCGPSTLPAQELLRANVTKRLELRYFQALTQAMIIESVNTVLARQLTADTLERLKPKLERFHRAYRDVEPGDIYALHYTPQTGTALEFNGRTLEVIDGSDFAKAYFGIWLDDNPISDRLRKKLFTFDDSAQRQPNTQC
jgi:hypothetical protein